MVDDSTRRGTVRSRAVDAGRDAWERLDRRLDDQYEALASDVISHVQLLLDANPGATRDQIAQLLVHKYSRIAAAGGAVTAAPGAVPGVGTAVAVGSLGGNIALTLFFQWRMVMALAHLYGHDLKAREARKLEYLALLGLSSGVYGPAKAALATIAKDVAAAQVGRLSNQALARLNARIGTQIVTKYGAKKSILALGRLVPVGVGIAVAATVDYVATRAIGREALHFYSTTHR
jgi:uncharacterized protein (DUF697 family)